MANPQQHIKHYTLVDIEKYIQGKMSPAERHALEKAALQDLFLADALEGYTHSSPQQTASYLQHIQQQILNGRQQKNKQLFSKIWFKAAASVISICSVGAILWAVLDKENNLSKTIPNEQQILPPSKAIITPPNNIPLDKVSHQPNKKIPETEKPALPQQERTPTEIQPVNAMENNILKNEEDVVAKSLPSAPITQKEDNRLRIGYEGTEQKETGGRERNADDVKHKEGFDIVQKPKDIETKKLDNQPAAKTMQLKEVLTSSTYSKSVANDEMVQDADASPEGGWPAFEAYVQNKITAERAYATDTLLDSLKPIALTFSIDANGKPYNIQPVSSSGNADYDYTIISIIQQGPRWIHNEKNKRVKINIQLPEK